MQKHRVGVHWKPQLLQISIITSIPLTTDETVQMHHVQRTHVIYQTQVTASVVHVISTDLSWFPVISPMWGPWRGMNTLEDSGGALEYAKPVKLGPR